MVRIAQYVVILLYLLITAAAFLFTMTRIAPPVPRFLLLWSYGMMAPYQGDNAWNDDVYAEGQLSDGTWHPIEWDPYYPMGFGEANVRRMLRSLRGSGQEDHVAQYRRLAEKLLVLEQASGRTWQRIRLTYQRWPRSLESFDALRQDPFVEVTPIVTVP